MKYARRWCSECKRMVKAEKGGPNHILHLLLSVVTLGLWLIVWFVLSLSSGYYCSECGSRARSANPPSDGSFSTILKASVLIGLLLVGAKYVVDITKKTKNTVIETEDTTKQSRQIVPLKQKCNNSDFKILSFNTRVVNECTTMDCSRYSLVVELENRSKIACGVKLQITGRDKKGEVIATQSGWPASIRNISPNDKISHDFGPLLTYNPSIVKFEVRAVDVRVW